MNRDKAKTEAVKAVSMSITSRDEMADQYKVDKCTLPGISPEVIIWDSGSQVNWLSKQAINDWKSMEGKCRPTSIRIYTVDEVHTGSKPLGIVTITIKWAQASMTLSFVVMNDTTKKVIFGAPVIKNHIESISLSKMSMKTWSGHEVPFSELDYETIVPAFQFFISSIK